VVSQGDRNHLRHEACKKLLDDAAARLGVTPKHLCEASSEAVGLATWYEFQQTGLIPAWLEAHCYDILLKTPKKAENLLGGIDSAVEVKVFPGLYNNPLHDLDHDD
jgi:hypothetical protein